MDNLTTIKDIPYDTIAFCRKGKKKWIEITQADGTKTIMALLNKLPQYPYHMVSQLYAKPVKNNKKK